MAKRDDDRPGRRDDSDDKPDQGLPSRPGGVHPDHGLPGERPERPGPHPDQELPTPPPDPTLPSQPSPKIEQIKPV